MKAKQAGILSALLASACCIGPLLLVAIGLGSGAAFVGRYHWFLLIGGLGVLTWSWVKYLREKNACDCAQQPMEGRRGALITLIAATVIVLGFVGLNVSRYVGANPQTDPSMASAVAPGLTRVVVPVEGMTCATCEIAVRSAVQRVSGVKSVQVSVATNKASVDFDPTQANTEQIVSAINSTGYRAAAPTQSARSARNQSPARQSFAPERISVFAVPLQCSAAPEIGCGSLAKPLLLELEQQPGVVGAWLNETGTTLAVVGIETIPREGLGGAVQAAAEKRKIAAKELEGAARDAALKDFSGLGQWHRGAAVDELSKIEAGIIAARLVRRVAAKSALPEVKAEALRLAFTQSFERRFTRKSEVPPADETRDELRRVGREQLDETHFAALDEAIAPGYRPLEGEK